MATKIRLQRHGRKGYAYYHVVVADSRSPRDGRCIERLGTYNPNTNLKREGVLLKKHLLGGVKKGAFDLATAEQKFETWKKEKENALNKQIEALKTQKAGETKKRIEAEQEKSKAKAAEIAKKLAEAKQAEQEAAATENTSEETNAAENAGEEATAEPTA